MKLGERLKELKEAGGCSEDFRIFFDMQGLTQNEIPDNFLFDQCITMHIDENNVDVLPTYDDIWSKILDPRYLEVLTDLNADQAPVRDIELYTTWGPEEGKVANNMTFLFEKRAADKAVSESFRQAAFHKRAEYLQQYEQQREQTRREMEAER